MQGKIQGVIESAGVFLQVLHENDENIGPSLNDQSVHTKLIVSGEGELGERKQIQAFMIVRKDGREQPRWTEVAVLERAQILFLTQV